MNTTAAAIIAAKTALGASLALGILLTPTATARADEVDAQLDTNGQPYVLLTDLPGIDAMPECLQEDGGMPEGQWPCIWTNDGNEWLTYPERSYLILDDTR